MTITTLSQKIAKTLSIILIALMAASCSDDEEKAIVLDGIWQGTIRGDYYYNRYSYRGDWDTEIQFIQDGFSSHGYGYEVDYSYQDNRVWRSSFDWEIVNGYIYLYYNDGYNIIIGDYDLYTVGYSNRFKGIFQDYYTGAQLATFDLIKVSNWSDRSRAVNASATDVAGQQAKQ